VSKSNRNGLPFRKPQVVTACGMLGLCFSLIACVAASDTPRPVNPPEEPEATLARQLPSPIPPRDAALKNAGLPDELAAPPAMPRPAEIAGPSPIAGSSPIAAARYEGIAAPGVQITLKGDGSTGAGLRYRWVQTQGPPASLSDPSQAMTRVTVPEASGALGFLLVVSNEAGMDSVTLKIPVEGRPKAMADGQLRADAGDDQIAVVGRQITLNGSRSEPRGKIGYRWIQTGGPQVRLKIEEGHIFSFVPAEPGTYRFALVVADGGVISQPDEVEVTTAAPSASTAPAAPTSRASSLPLPVPAARDPELLGAFVRSSLARLDGGPALAEAMAETFDNIAGRIGLYRSYEEAFSEMSRRLDAIVPQEPARRAIWIERLFVPVTSRLVEEMRKEGLDLSSATGRAAPMTETQRSRMADVFRAIGEGAKAASRPE
jgi:hypothetical protein